MAVRAKVPNVDPVGACVGVNGARVKAIVNELGNEQIDIIEWDENPAQLIVNALSPAKVVSATADDEEKKAEIIVSEQQLSPCNRQIRTKRKTCSEAYRLWH
ncbi:MAG: hypothetical protein ACLRWA_10625 [Lachnospira sp.]